MPALIFLGRTWACASDDFVCAGVCNFLIRMSCVLILGVPFLLASDPAVCLPNLADKIFCVLMFLTLAALLIFDAALSLSSSKGGVMETNLRSSVPRLLGAVCTLSCILLVLNLANLYLASNIYTSCDKQVVNCYIAGNSIAMAHAIGFYFSLILHYRKAGAFWGQLANDPTVFKQGCLHPNVNLSTKQLVMLQRRKSVQRKLRSLGAFRRLPSWKNDQMNVQTEERVITSAAALFSDVFYVPDQWLDIQRIYRIAELTTAMYGKFLYYSMNLGIPGSTCRLFRHLPCCLNSCNSTSEKTQLSCCICSEHTCDLAAILEFTSLKEDQFVKLSYDNSVYQSPYFVAVDDVSHCIVISIRGTLSFDDTIVDLLYDGVRLTEVETFVESKTGKRPCFIGHRGMVERSRHLFNSLLTDRSLEIAFSKKPHYKLVVCGHSLGAGIASFLSAILRSTYPDVKGYAFSAPLGMMNQELANYCKPFLLSVVYGYDVFSRMNKSTISDFKWRLLDALSACKVPKHRLLSRGLFVCMRRCLCKWCLPKCFQVESSTTVGSDTLLLDTTTQEHLIYSFPQLHYHNDEMRIRLSLHDDTNNSGSTSVHRAARSSRFRPGPRSLLCWINPSSLLPISSQSTDPISNNHCTNDNGNNDTETDSDSSDRIHSSDPESYDLSNGVFGGLVLHLVDVNLDTTDNDSPTGCIVNEDFFEDVGNSPSVYNSRLQALLSTKSNRMSTCCKSRKPKKIIAGVWSSPQQFQTILVHPQMLTHHLPNRFLEAVDCLRQVLLSTSSNSYDNSDIFKGFKPSDFIRKLDISS
ncbi:Sn1-specific diacylglycerol lipase beta [Schistosoma japonicum]|nr:Sn1-specific diacylglycerol lipase beta [Schistosoma japonicum]